MALLSNPDSIAIGKYRIVSTATSALRLRQTGMCPSKIISKITSAQGFREI
jgi:hypothetical protein